MTSSTVVTTTLKFGSNHEPISLPVRVFSLIRSLFVFLVSENVLLWSRFLQGRRNPQAEVEGPYYVVGAPDRRLEEGKALLASLDVLKAFGPYLVTITVTSPKGEPVPHAVLDWWQADTAGSYSLTTYRLRGKMTTDAQGRIEVLTVAPGKYGPEGYERAGHFHFTIADEEEKKWETLTTQLYVCKGNDAKEMGTDFLNFVRPARPANMVQSWSIPSSDGKRFMDFPPLAANDIEAKENIRWWNEKLAEHDENLTVVAGSQVEIKMNAPPRLFFF